MFYSSRLLPTVRRYKALAHDIIITSHHYFPISPQFPYVSLVIPLVVFLAIFAKALATWKLNVKNVDEPVASLLDIFSLDVRNYLT